MTTCNCDMLGGYDPGDDHDDWCRVRQCIDCGRSLLHGTHWSCGLTERDVADEKGDAAYKAWRDDGPSWVGAR